MSTGCSQEETQWREDNWQLCRALILLPTETWGQASYSDEKHGEGFGVYQKMKTTLVKQSNDCLCITKKGVE